MTTLVKKEREKEDLKRRILDAARALFLEHGFERTSMRMIADRIGYSATTIYLHFKDKAAIFLALHSEAFQQMGVRMNALADVGDPLERLKAMGRVYIRFAVENPGLYDLMFIMEAPMDALQDCASPIWQEGQGVFDGLKATVAQCMAMGQLPKGDPEVMSFTIWSTVHGMAALHVRDRCYKVMSDTNRERILELGLEQFIAWLEGLGRK
ncbi:MAG: TetR/AcrR family transcriptional regulator [Flavobacteriales bacterium]|nr:TetR/AcrR family transcriptional regulator [Flavobacteriales bacterium]